MRFGGRRLGEAARDKGDVVGVMEIHSIEAGKLIMQRAENITDTFCRSSDGESLLYALPNGI